MTNKNWNSPEVRHYQENIRNKIPGYDLIYEQMLAIIETDFNPNDILIIGAGGGQELKVIGERYPQAYYTALDPSRRMLELAKHRIGDMLWKIDWYETTVDHLPVEKKYDVVTCHLMLHFLEENKHDLLNQISQRVKVGGLLFISAIMKEDEKESTLQFWLQQMQLNDISPLDRKHFEASFNKTTYPLSISFLKQVLRTNGFKQILPYFKSYGIEAYLARKNGE